MAHNLPRPQEIATEPEVAILALLQTALDLTIHSLIAAFPDLDNPETPYWAIDDMPTRPLAVAIILAAQQLYEPLQAYRKAVEEMNRETETVAYDIPF